MPEHLNDAKYEDGERPVPDQWRNTFSQIVEAFVSGDFRIERSINGVKPPSSEEATMMADNIDHYGGKLTRLPQESWDTSICRWMEGYWEVVVDLFTERDGLSDLVLFARVYERDHTYEFEIESVHVP